VPISPSITAPLLVFCCLKGWDKQSPYRKSFITIFIGIVLSFTSSYYYRGQTYWESIRAIPAIFGILFYFFLKWKHISSKIVEKSLVYLIVIFYILYIAQYYLIDYGINFLGIDDWMINEDAEMGGARIRVMSSSLYILGLLYGINQYILTRKNKYIIMAFFGIFIMFLAGYRQLFVSFALALLFMLYKLNKKQSFNIAKYIVLMVVLFWCLLQIPAVQEKLNGMVNRSNSGATLQNKDYIRVIQYEYFMNDFFKSPIEHFCGAGVPLTTSAYGKEFEQVRSTGIQYVDWGLLGMSWMIGITTIIGFLMFSIKASYISKGTRYLFIPCYFILLLSAGITNWEFFRNGNFLVHAMIIYLAEMQWKGNKTRSNQKVVNDSSKFLS